MGTVETPAVLVTLILTPDQFSLFDEIRDEAVDILDKYPTEQPKRMTGNGRRIFLDYDDMRMGLVWSRLSTGDILTLSVGAFPGKSVPHEGALMAAEMLRVLVHRAKILFEVEQSRWEITMLPLDEETMKTHGQRMEMLDTQPDPQDHTSFITFEPDLRQNAESDTADEIKEDLVSSIREAFKEANEEPSWAMQASALALSTAFVLVTPPVGVAMFTYAVLRQGADMVLPANRLDEQQLAC